MCCNVFFKFDDCIFFYKFLVLREAFLLTPPHGHIPHSCLSIIFESAALRHKHLHLAAYIKRVLIALGVQHVESHLQVFVDVMLRCSRDCRL